MTGDRYERFTGGDAGNAAMRYLFQTPPEAALGIVRATE
jgi:hypothetical protein